MGRIRCSRHADDVGRHVGELIMKDITLAVLGVAFLMASLGITLTVSASSVIIVVTVIMLALAGVGCIGYSMHLQDSSY